MLKWNDFGHHVQDSRKGELALFCPTCLQPRINVHASEEELTK